LHHELAVSFAQAALGATLTVPTLRETREVEIAPGSQPGDVIRLANEGITHLRGRGRGDLFVHLRVERADGIRRRVRSIDSPIGPAPW
jgi:molecular chaperone DnaJ